MHPTQVRQRFDQKTQNHRNSWDSVKSPFNMSINTAAVWHIKQALQYEVVYYLDIELQEDIRAVSLWMHCIAIWLQHEPETLK